MKMHFLAAALAISLSVPATSASAQRHDDKQWSRNHDSRNDHGRVDRRWQGDRRDWDPARSYHAGKYRERRLGRNDRIYRGRDGRAYCRRADGTTGLVIGALGGGLLANLAGGGTLGTLIGAGGGALVGRSIDRGQIRCR